VKAKSVKVYERVFVVVGSGEFPLDMLHYDSAFPATERDAGIAQQHSERRRVVIKSRRIADAAPSIDRWASFGWRVEREFFEQADAECFRNEVLS